MSKFLKSFTIILLYLSVFAFSLGQIGRISFFDQQINVYIYEIGICLILLALFIQYRLKPLDESYHRARNIFIWLGYLVASYAITGFQYNPPENMVGLLYLIRLNTYFFFFFYLGYYFKKNISSHLNKRIVLVLSALVITGSLLQYFLYPDLRNLLYMGWDPHLSRLIGTFFEPPVSGSVFGLLALFIFLKGKSVGINSTLRQFIITALGAGVFLTYSRGIYIAFFLTLFIYLIKQKYYRGIFAMVVAFAIAVVLVPKPFGEGVNLLRVYSIKSRAADYQVAIETWKQKPLFGVGYNRIRYERPDREEDMKKYGYSHAGSAFSSSFMTMLAAGGIVGLLAMLAALWSLAHLNMFSFFGVIFISIASMIDNLWFHGMVLFLFLFLSSLVSPSHTSR